MKLFPWALLSTFAEKEPPRRDNTIEPGDAASISVSELEAFAKRLLESNSSVQSADTNKITAVDVASEILGVRTKMAEIMNRESLPISPVLDILLDLFINEDIGRKVSVSDAAIAGQCPATTGLRWIRALEKAGLIQKTNDAGDHRRRFISLTSKGREMTLHCIQAFSTASTTMTPE